MQKITPVAIATVFSGCFLGAGFLSGQEILQFFGVFGGYGLAGMVLSIAAFVFFSFLVLRIARRTGRLEFDHIIVPKDIPWLRNLVGGFFLFFLFDVMVAMIAGAGALLQQVLGVPAAVGAAIMSALTLVVALAGAAGMMAVFNIVVPLLLAASICIGVFAFFTLPAAPIEARPFVAGNPLLGNWFFSALSFISYNMIGSVSILVPLAVDAEEEKTIRRGLGLGAVMLALIFVFILLPMILYGPLVAQADLPMLELAWQVSGVAGAVYAVLLFFGMFTASLSSLFAVTTRIQLRVPSLSLKKFVPFLCVLAFLCSLLGFKNMVAVVYPICGYVGFLALAGILIHYVALKKEKAETP